MKKGAAVVLAVLMAVAILAFGQGTNLREGGGGTNPNLSSGGSTPTEFLSSITTSGITNNGIYYGTNGLHITDGNTYLFGSSNVVEILYVTNGLKITNGDLLNGVIGNTVFHAVSGGNTAFVIESTSATGQTRFFFRQGAANGFQMGQDYFSNGDDTIFFYDTDIRLFIDKSANNGNIGIGTATPRAKLDIAGTIYAKTNIAPYDISQNITPALNQLWTNSARRAHFSVSAKAAANTGTATVRIDDISLDLTQTNQWSLGGIIGSGSLKTNIVNLSAFISTNRIVCVTNIVSGDGNILIDTNSWLRTGL